MTIPIRNDSVAAVVRGYIVDSRNTLVWLELAPLHPKTIGAIWADLVVQQRPCPAGCNLATVRKSAAWPYAGWAIATND